MSPESPTVRIDALPSEHVDEVARFHRRVFADSEARVLSTRYAHAYIAWLQRYPENVALCAIEHEQVCGYVVGLPAARRAAFYFHLLPWAAVSLLRSPEALLGRDVRRMALARFQLLWRADADITHPVDMQGTMYLTAIGVVPSARGRGVGRQLLDHFADAARQRQMRSILLTVPEANGAARALYERAGFHCLGPAAAGRLSYSRPLADNLITPGGADGGCA